MNTLITPDSLKPKFSQIFVQAAHNHLYDPELDYNNSTRDVAVYSCLAISKAHKYNTGYYTDRAPARMYYRELYPDLNVAEIYDCKESQGVRFMLLMFASYLAADEGL